MALHKDFPKDKFQILDPQIRWFPAEEDLRKEGNYGKLLPPFVTELREKIFQWRKADYTGASETSKALLNWWFKEPHTIFAKDGSRRAMIASWPVMPALTGILAIPLVSNDVCTAGPPKLNGLSSTLDAMPVPFWARLDNERSTFC